MNKQIQIVFDINRSLKANPPHLVYDNEEGIKFIERKIGKLSDLRTMNDKGMSLQPREKTLDDKQRNLKNSFESNGVMYDKEVMVAEICKDGVEELISGYGRLYTFQEMGVDHYFYDVVEFESVYWKEVWKTRFNNSKDHNAQGTPPTEGSYIKTLVHMSENNAILKEEDDEIRLALFRCSNGQLTTKQIEKLLRKFRKSNSKYSTIIAMDKSDANRAAKKLGLPTSGFNENSRDPSFHRTGFVCRNDGNLLKETMSWAVNYKKHGKPVEIVGYVEHTELDAHVIAQQRKNFKEMFDSIVEDKIKPIFKEEFHNMVQFQGFLAQIQLPNPDEGGLPMERGLVDVDGKIIYEMVDGKKVYPRDKKEVFSIAA